MLEYGTQESRMLWARVARTLGVNLVKYCKFPILAILVKNREKINIEIDIYVVGKIN